MPSTVAMTRITTHRVDPKISQQEQREDDPGMAIRISTRRLNAWSSQPPTVAAKKPAMTPTTKARAVVTRAMPMVLRAPRIRRESMSRPTLSRSEYVCHPTA